MQNIHIELIQSFTDTKNQIFGSLLRFGANRLEISLSEIAHNILINGVGKEFMDQCKAYRIANIWL